VTTGNIPPQQLTAQHQLADQEAINRAQEFQEAQQKAAEAHAEALRIAEEQRRQRAAAMAGHAARIGWSSHRG